MTTVGLFAAKTHLSELLKRVAKGEKITITVRGKPVARLMPIERGEEEVARVVKEMLAWRDREGPTLGPDLTIRQLIEEGRR